MKIGISGKEICEEQSDQESRRMRKDLDRDRESQGALKKLGLVLMRGFWVILISLSVADWQQTNLYMRALATRFPSASFRAKSMWLSTTRKRMSP